MKFLMVFSTEELAREFTASGGRKGRGEGVEGVCFSSRAAPAPLGVQDSPTTPSEWSASLEPAVNVSAQYRPPTVRPTTPPSYDLVVTALHQERLVETRIHVSSSWMSRDRDPVLSVSLGWVGRERKM